MLESLIQKEKNNIVDFFNRLDTKEVRKLLDIMVNCKGVIVFSGMGKSGIIAKKISVTLTSIGIKSIFLSPVNALHGDIGFVSSDDVVVLFSKSGESDELNELIPFLHSKKAFVASICFNGASSLAKASDFTLALPEIDELCPYNIIPTTSTAIQLIVGNILAIAIMSEKSISSDQFALNHPAGSIGRRLLVKVKDIMIKNENVPICSPHTRVKDIITELAKKCCGGIVIVDEIGHLQGVFTYGDLGRAIEGNGAQVFEMPIEALMVREPKYIEEESLAWEAARIIMTFKHQNINIILPVLDKENKVVGLVRRHDITNLGSF
jgi:arabinose-5-phosphate isomerase